MSIRLRYALSLGAIGLAGTAWSIGAQPPEVPIGKVAFEAHCAVCHGADLNGSDHAVTVRGPAFVAKWAGKPLELVAFIRANMPPGQADALGDRERQAVASYILSHNALTQEAAVLQSATASGPAVKKLVAEFESEWKPAETGFHNGTVPDFRPVTEAMLSKPSDEDWLSWRRTRDGQGHSPLAQVTPANVGALRLAWTISMKAGVTEQAPLVHAGVMYLPNPGGVIQAVNAVTGDVIWEYRYRSPDFDAPPRNFSRNIAIFGDKLFMTTFDAALVAVDARTGKELWRTVKADHNKGFFHTGGPLIANGVVVSGINGCEYYITQSCFVSGHDPDTGKELWRTATIAQPGDPNDASGAASRSAGARVAIPGSRAAMTPSLTRSTSEPRSPSRGWPPAGI